MSFLLEIVVEYFAWILGKKSQNELPKRSKRKAYIIVSIFLVLVVFMGLYSLAWIIDLIK